MSEGGMKAAVLGLAILAGGGFAAIATSARPAGPRSDVAATTPTSVDAALPPVRLAGRGEHAKARGLALACPTSEAVDRFYLYAEHGDSTGAQRVWADAGCSPFTKGQEGLIEDADWSGHVCVHVVGSAGCLWARHVLFEADANPQG